jgi:hypothetical protein
VIDMPIPPLRSTQSEQPLRTNVTHRRHSRGRPRPYSTATQHPNITCPHTQLQHVTKHHKQTLPPSQTRSVVAHKNAQPLRTNVPRRRHSRRCHRRRSTTTQHLNDTCPHTQFQHVTKHHKQTLPPSQTTTVVAHKNAKPLPANVPRRWHSRHCHHRTARQPSI